MKNLILCLLFSLSANASNWIPHSKLKAGSSQAFQIESECRRVSGEICYDLGDLPSSVYVEVDSLVDDFTKPIYLKEQASSCSDNSDCQSKLEELVCQSVGFTAIKNLNSMEVYCVKLNGYQQKIVKIMEQDTGLVSAYSAAKVVEGQDNAVKSNVQDALDDMNCGRKAIALVKVRIKGKSLSKAQRKALATTLTSAYVYLQNGDLPVAKDEVNALVADGVILSNGDKNALINHIDKCISDSK